MLNRYLLTCSFIWLAIWINAQEPLKHEKKIYVSPEKKIFISKAQPIYFRVSLSPDDNAPSYVLPSEETAKYANPMYFDAEGRNTLRSPYAVDPVTKAVVMPKRDVQFDMYVDGKAPVTALCLYDADKYKRNGFIYYGKGLKAEFSSKDEISGVEATFISVDGSSYQEMSKTQISFDKEKEYVILWYSVDHVGNVESPKSEKIRIDATPPATIFTIIGESKGKVLSSKASISLSAKDTLSGVRHIFYSINDGAEKIYTAPIPMSVLKDGKSKINYYSIDNVGNKEEVRVISASTEAVEEKTDMSTYSFYIDKEAPVIGSEIVGDSYKGKYLYISERSRFKINATDDKSGVANIMYSINNALLRENYTEPFTVHGGGLHTIMYASADNVGNVALAQSQQVFLDKSTPVSKVSFNGRQFSNRDTLFITTNTKIVISVNEIGSGVQFVGYKLDGSGVSGYSAPFTVEKEGFHTIEYNAKDNVNNTEGVKKCSFFVDNTAPKIFYNFSVKAIGEKTVRDEKYTIYPSNVMLYLAATDNASGGENLEYKINGGALQTVLPIKGLVPGNYEIEIQAYDALRNKSTEVVHFAIEE